MGLRDARPPNELSPIIGIDTLDGPSPPESTFTNSNPDTRLSITSDASSIKIYLKFGQKDNEEQRKKHREQKCVNSGPQAGLSSPGPWTGKDVFVQNATRKPFRRRDVDSFDRWVMTFIPKRGREGFRCLDEAYFTPPISATSLAELELDCIVGNPKLRHDINFDYELHFRPNNDGDRGRRKLELADDYWCALETELEIYGFLLGDAGGTDFRWTQRWRDHFRTHQKRIPGALATLRKILFAMTPDKDRAIMEEILDVDLIMQQIEHGSADLTSLAIWLAQFLKVHCAPIRDRWVDQMAKHITRGVQESEPSVTVKGLKMLFGILEAMKLDIANHQIRSLRPVLLNATIHFEQVYHEGRIDNGQVDVESALKWYHQSSYGLLWNNTNEPRLSRFVVCLLWSLMPLLGVRQGIFHLPQIFRPDFERLRNIRADIFALINEEICISRLRDIARWLGRPPAQIEQAVERFGSVLPAIIGASSWQNVEENVAVELIRIAATCSQPGSKFSRIVVCDRRKVAVDANQLCHETETWLRSNLAYDNPAFQRKLDTTRSKLFKHVLAMTEQHVKSSPMEMFQSLVSRSSAEAGIETQTLQPVRGRGWTGDPRAESDENYNRTIKFDSLCRRITHIAALHWNVWAPILYLNEGGYRSDECSDLGSDSRTSTEVSFSEEGEETNQATGDDRPPVSLRDLGRC